MSNEEKLSSINKCITSKYNEFVKQANRKIIKSRLKNNDSDGIEIVSDIVYKILNNINDKNKLDKYYKMITDDTFHLYIFKAIDNNCNFKTTPFMQLSV